MADLTQAQALGRAARYDAILLHYDRATEPLARQIVTELHSRGAVRQVPLCLVGPDGIGAAAYYDLGADEVVEDSAEPAELALRLARLVRRKRRLDGLRATVAQGLRLSVIDPLTGLRNRRYAMQRLTQIAETALRERLDFAVMLIDMDRFKEVNDRQGHAAGDAVLVAVAARMAATMAEGDLLARIGGEEFLVCLPGADPDSARRRAETLRRVIEDQPVALPDGGALRVTVSIGLAISEKGAVPLRTETVMALVDRADRALLAAKSAGRNRITVSQSAA